MTRPLVECIANFSEARRPEVVEEIKKAITSVPSAYLLDQHSDLDHNRTVLTFVGPPVDIEESAFRAIAKAAELIDLNEHSGEHPRIGAADVVPFVPISNISMDACIELARRLGKRVADQLEIPVYLYEEAASRPENKNLESIRRGQYETLKEEIGKKADRAPDFGPTKLGPAGATVIGARHPLIAFNVYLTTEDVEIAKKIAKAVRHSSGGLRYVKALGLLVEGQAQVSMNLTNYKRTPVARVVELIRREAARYGVTIDRSELVGLIPQEALIDAAQWYTQLDDFDPEQVLENRIAAVKQEKPYNRATTPASISSDFLDALASNTPAPGGGSASAFSGAAGAALVEMVARLTIGKRKYVDVENDMWSVLESASNLRKELTNAIEEDATAFFGVLEAYMLAKNSPEEKTERATAIQNATLEASRVPLRVAERAVEVMRLASKVVELGNLNAISDGATGSVLAKAALTGAGYNVRINTNSLQDQTLGKTLLDRLAELEIQAAKIEAQIQKILHERGDISPA